MSYIKPTDAGQKFLSKQATPADRTAISAVQLYEKQVGLDGGSGNTVFSLHKPYLPATNTLWVFVNGTRKTVGTHYTETNALTVTFGSALSDTDVVEFMVVGHYRVADSELESALFGLPERNNILINGGFNFWQRGTSFTTGDEYTADRWLAYNKTAVSTGIASTVLFPEGAHYLHLERSSAGASPGLIYRIEQDTARMYVGKQLTLSLWAYAPAGTSALVCNLRSADSADTFTTSTSHEIGYLWANSDAPTNWRYCTYTFSVVPSACANGIEIRMYRGNAEATTTRFAMVKLEEGNQATPFKPRPMAIEYALCCRYFQKSYNENVAPGTTTNYGAIRFKARGDQYINMGFFPDGNMRGNSSPTVTIYSYSTGAAGYVRNNTTSADVAVGTVSLFNAKGGGIIQLSTTPTVENVLWYHFTADAEL